MTWALPRVGTAAVAQIQCGSAQYGVKALFFDVFGTPVDWRTGIAREAEAHLRPRGYALDWLAFATLGELSISRNSTKSCRDAFNSPGSTFCIAACSTATIRYQGFD